MPEEKNQSKFPSEVIDLPSKGKLYPEEHPCSSGQIEIKYMTAREEDILTSQNLIRKGVVIQKLLDSLILTPGVTTDDLIIGDKNAIMVAARILAYGPEYKSEVTNPITGIKFTHEFNLADCPFKEVPWLKKMKENNFEMTLPISKTHITYKLLTGKEEKIIDKEIQQIKKLGSDIVPDLTTRLRYIITSVDGDTERKTINSFVDNMLSRDSLALRKELTSNSPDIELTQEIEIEGESVKVDIPVTAQFFWPNTQS